MLRGRMRLTATCTQVAHNHGTSDVSLLATLLQGLALPPAAAYASLYNLEDHRWKFLREPPEGHRLARLPREKQRPAPSDLQPATCLPRLPCRATCSSPATSTRQAATKYGQQPATLHPRSSPTKLQPANLQPCSANACNACFPGPVSNLQPESGALIRPTLYCRASWCRTRPLYR